MSTSNGLHASTNGDGDTNTGSNSAGNTNTDSNVPKVANKVGAQVGALIQDTNYYTSLKPYNKEEQIEKDIKNIKAYLQERGRTERFVNTPIVEERLNELKSRLLPIQAELARLESEFFRLEGELKLLVSCFSDEQKSRLISPDGDLLSSNLRVSSSGMEREINGIYGILIKNYNRSLELRNEKDKIIKDFKDDMWGL